MAATAATATTTADRVGAMPAPASVMSLQLSPEQHEIVVRPVVPTIVVQVASSLHDPVEVMHVVSPISVSVAVV